MILILFEIFLISLFYVSFSYFIRIKIFNDDKFINANNRIRSLSKEIKDAMAKNDHSKIEELNKEAMMHMGILMKSQFLFMLVVIPIYLIIWYSILPILQPNQNYTIDLIGINMNYKYWFLLITFFMGLIATLIFSLKNKKKMKGKSAS